MRDPCGVSRKKAFMILLRLQFDNLIIMKHKRSESKDGKKEALLLYKEV